VLYRYSKLDVEKSEIRFLTLLPGAFTEPIRLEISQEPWLIIDELPKQRALITQELRGSLPIGWGAWETMEGRIIYERGVSPLGPEYSSWQHPNPGFRSSED